MEKYRQKIKQLDEAARQEMIPMDDEENGPQVFLSLARGVSIYNPDIDRTFNDVFKHADQAMYMHKQAMKLPRTTTHP